MIRFAILAPFLVAITVAIAVFVAPAVAQENVRRHVPPTTTEGSFQGTWYRIEPSQRQALQMRQNDAGEWELRFYWTTDLGLEIDTEWAERHEFTYEGFPGAIELEIDEERSTSDELFVRYERRQAGERDTSLVETGEVRIFRSGGGLKIVWLQDPVRLEAKIGEPIAPYEEDVVRRESTRLWIMNRAARRLIAWDEIPW